MPHVPHLYLPGSWTGTTLSPNATQTHHLRKVLRRRDGDPVTYTDGRGRHGAGVLCPDGVLRGDEGRSIRPAPSLSLAVAAPRATERTRFLVEKLGELGIDRLVWVRTRLGQADPPRADKCAAWAAAALEQSGGSWLLEVEGPGTVDELDDPVWVADPAGGPFPQVTEAVTLLIGPEGGLEPGEVRSGTVRVSLGDRLLRVETAAVVGASLLLDRRKKEHGKGRNRGRDAL